MRNKKNVIANRKLFKMKILDFSIWNLTNIKRMCKKGDDANIVVLATPIQVNVPLVFKQNML
jgi:hypothetical protein